MPICTLVAALAIFRFKLGVLTVLAGSAAIGAAWFLFAQGV